MFSAVNQDPILNVVSRLKTKEKPVSEYAQFFLEGFVQLGWITKEQVLAADDHIRQVLAPTLGKFSVQHSCMHTFQDHACYSDNFFKFCTENRQLFGLARFTYGTVDGVQEKGAQLDECDNTKSIPFNGACLLIELLQGIPRIDFAKLCSANQLDSYVDPRINAPYQNVRYFMLDYILSKSKSLIDNGWIIALRDDYQHNRKVREPYFEKDAIFKLEGGAPFISLGVHHYGPGSQLFPLKPLKKCKSLQNLILNGQLLTISIR